MHKIILPILVFTSFSYSGPSYSFFGAQTSFINYDDTSSPSLGLKYGVQKGMWRSSLSVDHAANGSDSISSLMLQSDRGVMQNTMKDSPFKPHVGFSIGMLQHSDTTTDNGYGFGLNTGVTYILNDDIDLDLSYRYFSANKMDDIKSLNSLSFSLHYFY